MLEDVAPAGVAMDGASIGVTSRHLPPMNVSFRARCVDGLLDYLIAVVWMHFAVAIAVKNNGRDRSRIGQSRLMIEAAALPHGEEC